MKALRHLSVLFLLCTLGIGAALGQGRSAVDSLFYRGVAHYRNGHYRQALQILELLDRVYPTHSRQTGSLLMQGKTHYKLQSYNRALAQFNKINQNYPYSKYVDDANYGMATAYYRLNRNEDAVEKLLDVVGRSDDRRLQVKAARLSSEILDYRVEDEGLKELLDRLSDERSKAAVLLRLGQREIDKQHYQTARQRLTDFQQKYPNSAYAAQVQQLLEKAEAMGSGYLKVGVILPLTGPFAEQGLSLLSGIQYAVEEHNERANTKVDLVIRDSEGNIIQAIKAAQELCNNPEILAVIGELGSEITAAIAAVAREKNVPLLAPTATLDGITSLGKTIFQLNSNFEVRASQLADYAVSGLGLRRFAILAPVDGYGKAMRDAFVSKVEELGGEILSEKWYYENDIDLGPQFKDLRDTGLKQMIQDSLLILVPDDEWNDSYEQQWGEVNYVNCTFEECADSAELAVTAYDGIFLPVYGEDLPYVMPQLANYNIAAQAFGGVFWHNMEILEEHSRYIDGAVFLSDFYISPSDFKFHRLRDDFRIKKGKTPEKMEVYGYDLASLFLSVAGEKALFRNEIAERLASIGTYNGVRGRIVINENRVNNSVRLLQFRGGNILLIR